MHTSKILRCEVIIIAQLTLSGVLRYSVEILMSPSVRAPKELVQMLLCSVKQLAAVIRL